MNGEQIADPTGQKYNFQEFLGVSAIPNQFLVIPGLIVKPDPMLETPAIRTLLTNVADDAYGNTGRFHYRLYHFTNPSVDFVGDGLAAPNTGPEAVLSVGNGNSWGCVLIIHLDDDEGQRHQCSGAQQVRNTG